MKMANGFKMNDMNGKQKGDTAGLVVDVSDHILAIIEMSKTVTFDKNGLPTFPVSVFGKLKNWNQSSITKLQELFQNHTTPIDWITVIEDYLNYLKTGK